MTQVRFSNQVFQDNGPTGGIQPFGRAMRTCKKCGIVSLRLFDGKCGDCFAKDYVEKHPPRKKDDSSPGRKIRL